jgi:hypothetical protein
MIGSTRELGSLMLKNSLFQGWNEAQKRTPIFVPNAIVAVAGTASRVKMNAKALRP